MPYYSKDVLAKIAALTTWIHELRAEIARLETLRAELLRRKKPIRKRKPRDLVTKVSLHDGHIKEPQPTAHPMRVPRFSKDKLSTNGHHR